MHSVIAKRCVLLSACLAATGLLATGLSCQAAEKPVMFDKGQELLRKGEYAQAVQLFSEDLKASDRPLEQRARAYYFRAKAYAALKENALARADLNLAVWLKKLPSNEAAEAARLNAELEANKPAPVTALSVAAPVVSKPIEPVAAPVASNGPTQGFEPPQAQPAPAAVQAAEPAASHVATQSSARDEIGEPEALRTAPAWSQDHVAREQLPPPKAAAYIRPSSAFTTATTPSVEPQRPAVTPEASAIETGSLQDGSTDARTNPQPAITSPWQTDVAVRSPAPPQTPPQIERPAAASAPEDPRPVATQDNTQKRAAVYTPQPQSARSPVADVTTAPAKPASAFWPSSGAAQPSQPIEAAQTEPVQPQPASSVPVVGWMFENQTSPYDEDIARADELQRRYIEKIRARNQAAGPATGADSAQP